MKAVSELKYLGSSINVTQDGKKYYNVTLFVNESIQFSCPDAVYDYCQNLDFGTNVFVEFVFGSFNNRPTVRVGRIQLKK